MLLGTLISWIGIPYLILTDIISFAGYLTRYLYSSLLSHTGCTLPVRSHSASLRMTSPNAPITTQNSSAFTCSRCSFWNLKSHRILALLFSATFGDVSQWDLGTSNSCSTQKFLYTILATWLCLSVYYYVLDYLRDISAQPAPCIPTAVVDPWLYGFGALGVILCFHDPSDRPCLASGRILMAASSSIFQWCIPWMDHLTVHEMTLCPLLPEALSFQNSRKYAYNPWAV